jgi:hypothetical protein
VKSKLFTPSPKEHDCFVNPFTSAEGMSGFAPTTGAAAYPLKLGGGGAAKPNRMPDHGPVVSHNMDEY